MHRRLFPVLVLFLALTLTGCSVTSLADRLPSGRPEGGVAAEVATPAATSDTASTPGTLAAPEASKLPAPEAIQAVIQRANEQQQEAFTRNDPSIMRDTATAEHYRRLVEINTSLADGGIADIKLVKIEWGAITLDDATTAQATTFETWQTTYADGTTDQSRQRNVYTLVLEQGQWKIQGNAHPDAGSEPPSDFTEPDRPDPAPPALTAPPPGADTSHNWSGYAATGGTFTAVSGTWTVPETNGTGSFAGGATWVGIGGVSSRDLIQAGTSAISNGTGTVRYQAWIEMLPQPARPIALAVRPGDSVTVSITEQEEDQWLIAVRNHRSGQSYERTVQYDSSRSSAEWIEEAPFAGGRILPLEDFGTVHLSGGSTVMDGQSLTIAEAGAQPITMIDSRGSAIATPSTLTGDGTGFSVSRSTPVTPAPAIPPRFGRDNRR